MERQACPSQFELMERDAAGTLGSLDAHAAGCPRCQGKIAELVSARRELLGESPAEESLRVARRILAEADRRRVEKRRRLWFWAPVGLLPAAAALGLFALAPRSQGEGTTPLALNAPQASQPAQAGVRSKGQLLLRVYCKRGDEVFELKEGADALAGDRLRFEYSHDQDGHLLVFSVDDRGEVFPFYQDDSLSSMRAVAGANVMLPGSIELDAHHGWERVFAVWTRQPLSESAVRDAVAAALSRVGGDVRQLTALYIGDQEATYLMRRP